MRFDPYFLFYFLSRIFFLPDPATAHIPVLAISANAMPHDIKNGLEAGFFRYLTKPIKVNEFMDALNVALEYADKEGGQSK